MQRLVCSWEAFEVCQPNSNLDVATTLLRLEYYSMERYG